MRGLVYAVRRRLGIIVGAKKKNKFTNNIFLTRLDLQSERDHLFLNSRVAYSMFIHYTKSSKMDHL